MPSGISLLFCQFVHEPKEGSNENSPVHAGVAPHDNDWQAGPTSYLAGPTPPLSLSLLPFRLRLRRRRLVVAAGNSRPPRARARINTNTLTHTERENWRASRCAPSNFGGDAREDGIGRGFAASPRESERRRRRRKPGWGCRTTRWGFRWRWRPAPSSAPASSSRRSDSSAPARAAFAQVISLFALLPHSQVNRCLLLGIGRRLAQLVARHLA